MPAIINLHGHLGLSNNGADSAAGHYTEENVAKQLNKYLSYGVATMASFGQDDDLIFLHTRRSARWQDWRRNASLQPAEDSSNRAKRIPPTTATARKPLRKPVPMSRELATHHPDYLKMWVDDGLGHGTKMKPEIYRAIIDEAHKQHFRAFAHEYYLADAKSLLAAGWTDSPTAFAIRPSTMNSLRP